MEPVLSSEDLFRGYKRPSLEIHWPPSTHLTVPVVSNTAYQTQIVPVIYARHLQHSRIGIWNPLVRQSK